MLHVAKWLVKFWTELVYKSFVRAMGLKRVWHLAQARLKNSLKVWVLTNKFMLVYASIPMDNYEAKISNMWVLLLVCTTSALAPKTFEMVSAPRVSSR